MALVDCVERMWTVHETVRPGTMASDNKRQAQRYPDAQEWASAYDNVLKNWTVKELWTGDSRCRWGKRHYTKLGN